MTEVISIVKPFLILLLVGASLVFGQATPTAPPGDNPNNPNVFMGRLPKVDKSRLRDLKGVVKDDAEAPIENAVVQLKDLKTGKMQSFVTKADGSYLFYDLNMDQDYQLTAKWDQAPAPLVKKLTKYDTRKHPTLNFELAKKKAS